MGPGPSDVPERVLEAMARPTVGHLDPFFLQVMDEIKSLLHYAFRTENPLTFPVSGPGTAGMETCVVNLIEPGDTAVVCINGVFGQRLKEMIQRAGGHVVEVQSPWGRAVSLAQVEEALQAHPEAQVLAFVHAETSTGARSDALALAQLARRHHCLTLVDAVTSLGGSPLEVDAWGLDAVYSGSQKCLSCTPGLSPVTFSARAIEKIQARRTPVQSWFMDVNLVMQYWGTGEQRTYHHTAPINPLYGLRESLVILREEGIERAWKRHEHLHRALRAGLEALGLRFVVPEPERLWQLNAVWIPEGIQDKPFRQWLLDRYSLEIGGGLGAFKGKVWRIGLMGYSARPENVRLAVEAIGKGLIEGGVSVPVEEALEAVESVLLLSTVQ